MPDWMREAQERMGIIQVFETGMQERKNTGAYVESHDNVYGDGLKWNWRMYEQSKGKGECY